MAKKSFYDGVFDRSVIYKHLMTIAHEGLRRLQKQSKKMTGEYAQSWYITTDGGFMKVDDVIQFKNADSASEFIPNIIIKNKKYQLTHLLELGHMNQDGSYTAGDYLIRRTQKALKAKLVRDMKKALIEKMFK